MNLNTKRLLLRPVTLNDGAFILELMNTPDWIRFIGDRNLHSINDATKYIRDKMLTQYEEYGYGNFVMIDLETKIKLGTIGLYRRPGLTGVDLGFAILPKFYRNGYVYEASLKLINHAIENLNLNPLSAITTKENIPSQSIIKKLGFIFVEERKIKGMDEINLIYRYPQ